MSANAAKGFARIAQLIREADRFIEDPDGDALADRPDLRRIVADAIRFEELQDFKPEGQAN